MPAIALTAYTAELIRHQVLSAGFQQQIPKPIEPTEFIAIITGLFAQNGNSTLNPGSSLAKFRVFTDL